MQKLKGVSLDELEILENPREIKKKEKKPQSKPQWQTIKATS